MSSGTSKAKRVLCAVGLGMGLFGLIETLPHHAIHFLNPEPENTLFAQPSIIRETTVIGETQTLTVEMWNIFEP